MAFLHAEGITHGGNLLSLRMHINIELLGAIVQYSLFLREQNSEELLWRYGDKKYIFFVSPTDNIVSYVFLRIFF